MSTEDAYGVELDRRLNAERALAAVIEVVEAYESCGPKQQSTRDVLAAVRAAFEGAVLHGLDSCSQAPARALREAAQFFERDMSRSWGGDATWFTTGKRVADLVAICLRERAADLDADRVAGVRRELSEEPCPACGGSMRFCECMDDPFAAEPSDDRPRESIARLEDPEGVGTGAGEGATGQATGTAWVTRSADCPEAPAQAHPLGPDGFTPLVSDADYRAAFYRVMERCEELKTSVAEHQWNALEMARKADQAERRAEEAEFHVEQLRDARDRAERQAEDAEAAIEATRDLLDGWEQDGPEDPAVRLLIQRVREMLALGERFREARDGTEHE